MNTKVYKLRYESKDEAITDLINKGVIDEDKNYNRNTHAVVFVGKIVDVRGTYDEEGEELTPTTYKDGYHVDVMSEDLTIDFGSVEVQPNNEYHKFK